MDTEIENAAYKFAESQNDGSNFTAYYKGFIAGTKYKKSSNGVSLSMNIIPPMTDARKAYSEWSKSSDKISYFSISDKF